MFICSLKPRLLEKHLVNGSYWRVKIFWLGKARVLKIADEKDRWYWWTFEIKSEVEGRSKMLRTKEEIEREIELIEDKIAYHQREVSISEIDLKHLKEDLKDLE